MDHGDAAALERGRDQQPPKQRAGALNWRSVDADEPKALAKVRQKYFDEFVRRTCGTTHQFHFVAPNPWVIIGVFPIPHEKAAWALPSRRPARVG